MMNFNQILQQVVLLSLFVATIGTGYVFFVTLILNNTDFSRIFNSWHFPMLLAILVDVVYYKKINRLS